MGQQLTCLPSKYEDQSLEPMLKSHVWCNMLPIPEMERQTGGSPGLTLSHTNQIFKSRTSERLYL